jgi:hypothetical protein
LPTTEAQWELERSQAAWILIRHVHSKGLLLIPLPPKLLLIIVDGARPDRLPLLVGNESRRVEVIDVNVCKVSNRLPGLALQSPYEIACREVPSPDGFSSGTLTPNGSRWSHRHTVWPCGWQQGVAC